MSCFDVEGALRPLPSLCMQGGWPQVPSLTVHYTTSELLAEQLRVAADELERRAPGRAPELPLGASRGLLGADAGPAGLPSCGAYAGPATPPRVHAADAGLARRVPRGRQRDTPVCCRARERFTHGGPEAVGAALEVAAAEAFGWADALEEAGAVAAGLGLAADGCLRWEGSLPFAWAKAPPRTTRCRLGGGAGAKAPPRTADSAPGSGGARAKASPRTADSGPGGDASAQTSARTADAGADSDAIGSAATAKGRSTRGAPRSPRAAAARRAACRRGGRRRTSSGSGAASSCPTAAGRPCPGW
ncbi:unnamed protein product [Prorocentrum cordatum]|uniref:Uncharacterized protein n=1 Tax=Prorocentrum cordatum TaxID=2364126 RepID=A0ABN9TIP1_9DINO|nr:unnamed protein product [Polarella glacialis]